MTHFKFIITLLSIVFVFISCNTDNPVSYKRSERDEIVPLAVGNYWKYEYNETIKDAKSDSMIIDFHINSNETVVKDTIDNTQHIFSLELVKTNLTTKNTTIEKYFALNDKFGYKTSHSLDNFGLNVVYPANISDFQNSYCGLKLVSKNDLLKTKAGTFICYHFQCQTKDSSNGEILTQVDAYYAVGVGFVKLSEFGISTEIRYYRGRLARYSGTTELTEYSVK